MNEISFLNLAREAALIELSLITGNRVFLPTESRIFSIEEVEFLVKTQSLFFFFLKLMENYSSKNETLEWLGYNLAPFKAGKIWAFDLLLRLNKNGFLSSTLDDLVTKV